MSDGRDSNNTEQDGKSFLDNAKETLNSSFSGIGSSYKEYMNLAKEYAQEAKSHYDTFNNEGPNYISQFKRDYVFPINHDTRYFGHVGVTLFWIVLSLKMKRGMFITLRDTAFLGLGYGALFNPESVNPFLNWNWNEYYARFPVQENMGF